MVHEESKGKYLAQVLYDVKKPFLFILKCINLKLHTRYVACFRNKSFNSEKNVPKTPKMCFDRVSDIFAKMQIYTIKKSKLTGYSIQGGCRRR
jgi:hypothetical protein